MTIQGSRLNFLGIDRFLRSSGIVVGIFALPLNMFVSGMASDSGTPEAIHLATTMFYGGTGLLLLGILCAFVPELEPPVTFWRLVGYLLLRLPTYAVALIPLAIFVLAYTSRRR
jgi:hypothetical protein